jgi:hypothetical protein
LTRSGILRHGELNVNAHPLKSFAARIRYPMGIESDLSLPENHTAN